MRETTQPSVVEKKKRGRPKKIVDQKSTVIPKIIPDLEKKETCEFDPKSNYNVISLVKQTDGNWKGYWHKYSSLIEVREVSAEQCLLRLLTHP